MEPQNVTRKLAAILAADIVGYSRLMSTDEAGTLAQLKTHRKEIIDPKIAEHRGRIVKTTGDGILVEFASVVDAVQCAVEVQRAMAQRNAQVPKDRRVEFRVGINLGDIIIEGDDIYGDGVNVAARLEGLAEPGEICISGTAFDHVKNKLEVGFENLGEQEVKNIAEPVRAYRVRLEPEAAGTVTEVKKTGARRWGWAVAAAVAVVVLGGAAYWNFYLRPPAPQFEPASVEKMAFPLPEKPSIAVLPFTNLSGDPKQEYFSDGITEDIITDLSKLPNLFVIARNSTFTYKGKPVKVRQVAEELGVRYVLEGSFRRAGQRVRITAQLVDATTGRHVWAERYDREFKDVFALQDDITQKIVTAMEVKLTEGEIARILRRQTNNLEAYQLYLRGWELSRRFNKADQIRARRLFEKAVELDPNFAAGWWGIAVTYHLSVRFGWSADPARDSARAEEFFRKALAIDDSYAGVYMGLGQFFSVKRQHEKAIAYGEKSVALEPNFARANALLGLTLVYAGRPGEALVLVKRAMRLSPYYPPAFLRFLGLAYRSMGQDNKAIAALERVRARLPNSPISYVFLAMTYAEAGRQEEARAAAAEVLKRSPKFSVKRFAKAIPFKDPAELKRALDSLRKAGLPENPPLPLPDKPSIAVLPFTNMSDDPKQKYFADGITEDIITDLSKLPNLFVIARNSSFKYKGKSVDVRRVARDLGVRYVLEGSYRKAGQRVRITAQLVDATTGRHLWAERYDREFKDVFALQDEITQKVVTAMEVKLTEGEQARIRRRQTDNPEAYQLFRRGQELQWRNTKVDVARARRLYEKAVELDPNFAAGWSGLAGTRHAAARFRWSADPARDHARAEELARKALAIDDSNADAYQLLGQHFLIKRQHEKAIAYSEKAVALQPNHAFATAFLALTLVYVGRPQEGFELVKRAMRLSPYYPPLFLRILGVAHRLMGQYDQAIEALERARARLPNSPLSYIWLAMTYAEAGREEEARAAVAELLKRNPKFSVRRFAKMSPYKDPAELKRSLDAMRKAGLPD